MELDEYKIMVRQKVRDVFPQKSGPELHDYMRRKTLSVVDSIKNNLKLEIVFALLFSIFVSYIMLTTEHHYLKVFTILLLAFSICFTYYLIKLLKYIQFQRRLVVPVKLLLERYIKIIVRFTRLYFQLTMVFVPLVLILAFISGYLDNRFRPDDNIVSFSPLRLWIYFGLSVLWSLMMYFFTRWYVKILYGNYLSRLRQQLKELEEE